MSKRWKDQTLLALIILVVFFVVLNWVSPSWTDLFKTYQIPKINNVFVYEDGKEAYIAIDLGHIINIEKKMLQRVRAFDSSGKDVRPDERYPRLKRGTNGNLLALVPVNEDLKDTKITVEVNLNGKKLEWEGTYAQVREKR